MWTISDRAKERAEAFSSKEKLASFIARCREDKIYFVNTCIDQINPQKKKGHREGPFFPCLRQREALLVTKAVKEKGIDVVWPKARKVGASWIQQMDDLHSWLFESGYSSIISSYDKNLIESSGKGNMNTLMEKFDFMYRRLPSFFHDPAYGEGGEGKAPYKVDFIRTNPATGAVIWGQAMTENFGAGGRGGKAFLDELSRATFQKEAWVSCGQTSSSRHAVLTPQGKDFAWGLCFPEEYKILNGLASTENPYVFRIDWRDIDWLNEFIIYDVKVDMNKQNWRNAQEFDAWMETMRSNEISRHHGYAPIDLEIYDRTLDSTIPLGMGYDDGKGNIPFYEYRRPLDSLPNRAMSIIYPWRIKEGFRYDSQKAAQELDISFDDGKRGRVYAIQFRSVRLDLQIPRISKYPLYAGVDPGRGTGNAFYIGINQWNPEVERYQWIREFSLEGRSCYFFIPFLTGDEQYWELAERQMKNQEESKYYRYIFEEMKDPAWRLNMAFCDPAATSAKMASAHDSIENIWRAAGIPVRLNHAHRDFDTRITAARRVMGYTDIDRRGCPVLATSLSQIEYPKESDNTNKTTQTNGYVHHPLYSHACAGFEYHACFDPHHYDRQEKQAEAPEQRIVRKYIGTLRMPDYSSSRRDEY